MFILGLKMILKYSRHWMYFNYFIEVKNQKEAALFMISESLLCATLCYPVDAF